MKTIGHPESTCAKSWHHTVATPLQDSNANPQLRQQVMKHSPSLKGSLVITVRYPHTHPETLRRQGEEALQVWPKSLELALKRARTL
jgi:hypothetical protein